MYGVNFLCRFLSWLDPFVSATLTTWSPAGDSAVHALGWPRQGFSDTSSALILQVVYAFVDTACISFKGIFVLKLD